MEKISIIVPMYNSEKYIEECLKSIVKQSYKNLEIILINDGSIDKTKNICEKYKKIDNRILLIDRKNRGVSYSRNEGIKKATGNYICFVDSDDYLSETYVEEMIREKDNADLFTCGYILKYIESEEIKIGEKSQRSFTKEEALKNLFNEKLFRGFLWNKMFKKSIIDENNLFFDENISMCEDLLFVYKYVSICNNILYIPKPLYYYRMRKGGISSESLSMYQGAEHAYKEMINFSRKNKIKISDDFWKSYIKLHFNIMISRKVSKNERKMSKKYILSKTWYIVSNMNFMFKMKLLFAIVMPRIYMYMLLNYRHKNLNKYYE